MTSYGKNGAVQEAQPPSLLAVLRALGAPVTGMDDIPEAIRHRKRELKERCLEPVIVAWDGELDSTSLNLPAEHADRSAECCLVLETGEECRWRCDLSSLPVLEAETVEGREYVTKQLMLPSRLPLGYHRLIIEHPWLSSEALVICAPRRLHTLSPEERIWGVFIPLYALHSSKSWGAGDFTELETLVDWVSDLGGSMVGSLPLLASFLDDPFEPSPYSPVSRLFWNEFYLDVTRVPELLECPEAQAILNSGEFSQEIASLRADPLVEYRRLMAAKRCILEHLARAFFNRESLRRDELQRWAEANPRALDYARFRAAVEHQRAGWPAWPERMREGIIQEGDYDPATASYHLYAQWLVHEQLGAVAAKARQKGKGLYLDLPLGVNAGGYDTWKERNAFALEASSGAPPDLFFSEGQDWGIPPLHPERIREEGYRYFIACLRNHLQYAGILRIDHVMGLHRLFWVPKGMAPWEGVYVHYRSEEFYAILSLESNRYKALIVGEDLGTVPDYVRPTMRRHGVYGMYVLPFELRTDPEQPLRSIPNDTLACLNTHDMRPFAHFWENEKAEIKDALLSYLNRLGMLNPGQNSTAGALRACLSYIAASDAGIMLVNLEDLWLEKNPQNAPDLRSYPHWRRKAFYPLEAFTRSPEIAEVLDEISRLRRGKAYSGKER
ncbi:MAG: 4-alpha-glucanotransferase [Thermacetogeniaceae bacterium]